ncbi:MAG: leucine-rich repeat domain-containing protein [Firmicutes bacterium]|nr:leucine-rich repeat domain-containing protein [Bacillota bacterium]
MKINRFKKYILTLFLLLLSVLLISCSNNNTSGSIGLNYEFIEELDGYSVTSYDGTEPEVVVPKTYNGKHVIAVKDSAFKNNSSITSIQLPNTIELIDDLSFQGTSLSTFTIPFALEEFAHAFGYNMTVEVYLPSSHEFLKEITVSGQRLIVSMDEEKLVYVYRSKIDTANITIPNGIKYIAPYALFQTGFFSALIPNSVENIERYAFAENPLLQYSIPSNIKNIGEGAFQNTRYHRKLILPEGLLSIGSGAFSRCGIDEVVLPSTLYKLGRGAFGNSAPNKFINLNAIVKITFNSFNLDQESLTDFTYYFTIDNFLWGYYEEV